MVVAAMLTGCCRWRLGDCGGVSRHYRSSHWLPRCVNAVLATGRRHEWSGALRISTLADALAVLVQLLGTVIGSFPRSARRGGPTALHRPLAADAGQRLLLLLAGSLAAADPWLRPRRRNVAATALLMPMPAICQRLAAHRSASLTRRRMLCYCWRRPHDLPSVPGHCLPCGRILTGRGRESLALQVSATLSAVLAVVLRGVVSGSMAGSSSHGGTTRCRRCCMPA